MGLTKPRAAQIYNLDYKQATRVVAVTNITLSGGAPATVDGVSLNLNNRVLVTAQSTGSQNGIYLVTTVGSGSNGTWGRTTDANDTGEVEAGMIIMVTEGAIYADTQWKLITDDPIVIDTTALTFTQNYSANSITGGTSNVTVYSNANVTISSAGTANVLIVSSTGTVVKGTESVSGNITVGNVLTGGLISATGNITGNYILGNGSQLTGLPATYGNSNVTSLLAAFGSNTISTSGTVTSGNVTGANILTGGLVSATGAINTDANIIAGTNTKALPAIFYTNTANTQYGALLMQKAGVERWLIGSDNSTGNGNVVIRFNATTNYLTVTEAGAVIVGSNITGGNILTGGLISSTGTITGANITGSNILTGGLISATGNITGGNISATNHTGTTVSITGTVTAASTVGGVITGSSASVSGAVTGASVVGGSITISGNNIISSGVTLTIDPNGSGGNDGNVVIAGNLSVTGNMTYINSNNVTTNVWFAATSAAVSMSRA